MSDKQKLNVVDEAGNVIDEATREDIHRLGLLHREVHVWFFTPKGEIIFQKRSDNTDTYPNLLDATVGGHVEIGADFESAALTELEEETGIKATKNDLILIEETRSTANDKFTGMTNNVIRAVYAYRFTGELSDLKIEDGKSTGFEIWPIAKILNISEKERQQFVPSIIEDKFGVFKTIQNYN